MKDRSADKARLQHILEAISEIKSYTRNDYFETFSEHSIKKLATAKQLEIIGEAANHISSKIKASYSEVSWREITGVRNILVPEYFGIDERIV